MSGGQDDGYQSALAAARRATHGDAGPSVIYGTGSTTNMLGVAEQAALREAARHEMNDVSHGSAKGAKDDNAPPLAEVMNSVLARQQRPVSRVPDVDKAAAAARAAASGDGNNNGVNGDGGIQENGSTNYAASAPPPTFIGGNYASAPRDETELLLVSDREPYSLHDIFGLVFEERTHAEYKNEMAEFPYDLTVLVLAVWLLVAAL